jgi:hypothetical protein
MPNSGGCCASTADSAEHSIDNTSVGLSIAANHQRAPRASAADLAPASRICVGVVLSSHPDPDVGQVEMTFATGDRERAAGCATATTFPIAANGAYADFLTTPRSIRRSHGFFAV